MLYIINGGQEYFFSPDSWQAYFFSTQSQAELFFPQNIKQDYLFFHILSTAPSPIPNGQLRYIIDNKGICDK